MARSNHKSIWQKPGTVIKSTLAAWGITEKAGCGCYALANKMDREGPDVVELRLDSYYVPKMQESIKNWRSKSFVTRLLVRPPDEIVKKLIEYGIWKSRQPEPLPIQT